jgi:acyl-CoA thioesterase
VEIVRQGRRVSTTRVTLWQGDRPCLDTLISCGEVPAGGPKGEGEWSGPPPPDLPPPDECIDSAPPNFRVELLDHFELRLDPSTAAFPTPSGEPVFRGWCRLRDGGDPDVLSLLVAVDAFPPTVFNLGRFGWAPTVELTVLLRGVPAPGWLQCEARTRILADGWFDEEASVWDSTGRLVAQSRQLALAATP